MQPRILFITGMYPEFLQDLYRREPQLADLDYAAQQRRLFDTFFGASDAYSHGLRLLGCETADIICNADALQRRWANDHGLTLSGNIHDQRRQIVAAQIRAFRPDVLYVFEWNPLGDAFLAEVKPHVRLLVGQIASSLFENRTFGAYDVMVSSYQPIVDHFHAHGRRGEYLRLGFDARVLECVPATAPRYDVTFIGGFAPAHPDRVSWLERLLREVNVDIFCYGIENAPADSPVRAHWRGQAWGLDMYRALRDSRITLNRHARIDVRGEVVSRYANNMRLYEATGMATCLITDERENMEEFFAVGREVITYKDDDDCLAKVQQYLADEPARRRIAEAGHQRTLREHCYTERMKELLEILRARLGQVPAPRAGRHSAKPCATAVPAVARPEARLHG